MRSLPTAPPPHGASPPPTLSSGTEGPALLPSPWPLWQAPLQEVLEAVSGQQLSAAWKLFLLGDGSPTRHLQLLTGQPLEVELIAMAPEAAERPGAPAEVEELAPPLVRRQVWLNCGGQSLGWAESWWNQAAADTHLQERGRPIWHSLTSGRAELFREVDGLAQVDADWLEQRFGAPGPYWSRHYRFFRQGQELTVIREVFSPLLQQWLGPCLAPQILKTS